MGIYGKAHGYSRNIVDHQRAHLDFFPSDVEPQSTRRRIVRLDLPQDLYEQFEAQANEVEMPVNIFIANLLRRLGEE